MKSLYIGLFDNDRVVHQQFVPQVQTLNQHFYTDVLQPKILRNSLLKIFSTLARNRITVVPHPPYAHDLDQ